MYRFIRVERIWKYFLLAAPFVLAYALVPDRENTSPDSEIVPASFPAIGDLRPIDRTNIILPPDLLRDEQEYVLTLEEKHGDLDSAMNVMGCEGQAPGIFSTVYRTGDVVRDKWCSRDSREEMDSREAELFAVRSNSLIYELEKRLESIEPGKITDDQIAEIEWLRKEIERAQEAQNGN